MKISVVIPLYNKEKHIQHTIETVLSQTYSDFELVVVDDGSTDASANIVRAIKDDRIRLIQTENNGVSTARNIGIKNASSEYIAFIDADDEWDEHFLEEIVQLIELFPDAGIWATAFYVQERSGEKYALSYPELPTVEGREMMNNYFRSSIEYSPLCSSSVCVSSSALKTVGFFPEEIKNGEDLDLWCRIALQYRIAYSAKPLAVYRRDSSNMASRNIETPCYFPFLTEYDPIENKIIDDPSSIEKYILQRQFEAVSASLFIIRNKNKAKKILKEIKYRKYNIKKFYAYKTLSFFPKNIIDLIYKMRLKRIKTFE